MIMSIWKMGVGKHIQNPLLSRVGIRFLLIFLILTLTACYPATYREVPSTSPAPPAPMTQVYFYPTKAGQTTEQQSRDHYECYNWAVQQTGFDPSQLIHSSRTARQSGADATTGT